MLADLEPLEDIAEFVHGADAVVFAAGAGPGSGPERKRTVDLGAAVKLRRRRRSAPGSRRYLMVSSMGAGDPAASGQRRCARTWRPRRRPTPPWSQATCD